MEAFAREAAHSALVDTYAELRSFARTHGALKAGFGRTDDVEAFVRWLEITEPERLGITNTEGATS